MWRNNRHRSAMCALLCVETLAAKYRGDGSFYLHQWAHFETRNPVCWGPRSWHMLPPLGGCCAMVGPGRVGIVNRNRGGEGSAGASRVGQRGGGRTCTTCFGACKDAQARVACFASFLTKGGPRGATDAEACGGGVVFSFASVGLDSRPPPLASTAWKGATDAICL